MPIPPVSQCRKMQTASPLQEKKAGTKASKARACRDPIQIKGTHASRVDAGRAVVVVVIINLCSYTSLRMDSWWWEGYVKRRGRDTGVSSRTFVPRNAIVGVAPQFKPGTDFRTYIIGTPLSARIAESIHFFTESWQESSGRWNNGLSAQNGLSRKELRTPFRWQGTTSGETLRCARALSILRVSCGASDVLCEREPARFSARFYRSEVGSRSQWIAAGRVGATHRNAKWDGGLHSRY